MTTAKDVLTAMLDMVGQTTVYAECGSDFEPYACADYGCNHYHDCSRQQDRVDKTKKIKAMIAVMD